MDDYYASPLELAIEYLVPIMKVSMACSPVIVICLVLVCAREDEDEEKAKQERAKAIKSCKP